MLSALFRLPKELNLQLEDVVIEEKAAQLLICATNPTANCPLCGQSQNRVHSYYTRAPMDLPCVGLTLRLILKVRRFFCLNQQCSRSIFTERLPGLVMPYARRTQRQAETLSSIAFALGGKAGARLTTQLGMAVSPDTLLRLIRHTALTDYPTPPVLAVDDFAFRKGHTYGSLLIDLERHQIVDLLADREADSFAKWLEEHPGVEIISRDRAGAYADGARRGAPDAVQVADRFHLLVNLSTAVEHLFERKNKCLQQVVQDPQAELATPGEVSVASVIPAAQIQLETKTLPLPTVLTPIAMAREAARQRRKARYEEVITLRQKGATQAAIAEVLDLHPATVRRYLQAEIYPEIRRPNRPNSSKLKPYQAYLQQRWAQGEHNVKELGVQIRAQGYRGGNTIIYDYLHTLREQSEWMEQYKVGKKQRQANGTKPPRPLYPREAAWLYVCNPRKLTIKQVPLLEKLRQYDEETGTAYQLAQDFRAMVTKRRVNMLGDWLKETQQSGISELKSLANGIQRDLAAVRSALELEWSNGTAEGFVNKTKMVKRQMFGRANFDLLRSRMLGAKKARLEIPGKVNVLEGTELQAVA